LDSLLSCVLNEGGLFSMSKRRNFSAEFKVEVALDALSGELTLAELAG